MNKDQELLTLDLEIEELRKQRDKLKHDLTENLNQLRDKTNAKFNCKFYPETYFKK